MNIPRARWFARQTLACILGVVILVAAGCSDSTLPNSGGLALSAADAVASERPTLAITSPVNGATVVSPFTIDVQTENLRLAPKGAVRDGEAHMHVIVSGTCVPSGEVIVDDALHVHYGDGTAELVVALQPGDYDLCVQAGDGFHVALGITHQLSVTVVESLPDSS